MIDELQDVLTHERDAAAALEGRLRALELLLASGEPRFLSMAVDEVNDAAERLAALELTRVLALSSIGAPVDVTARDVVAAVDGDRALPFAALVDELRATMARVTVRREQVRHLLDLARTEGEQRLNRAGAAQLV